jgi:hypothetical protein
VFAHAVEFLEAQLSSLGFKAALSQLSLSRKLGNLSHVIRLRPSGTNLSGVGAEVSVEVFVRSSSLRRWTHEEGTKYARDTLWIRQLGYLGGRNEYLKWQLVDPATRRAELLDLLEKVRSLAIPALDAWSSKQSVAAAVFRFSEVERIDWLVEAALWAGDREAATRLISDHLRSNPKDQHSYASELARFLAEPAISEPLPHAVSGSAFLGHPSWSQCVYGRLTVRSSARQLKRSR